MFCNKLCYLLPLDSEIDQDAEVSPYIRCYRSA
jgi:hypothetical protein